MTSSSHQLVTDFEFTLPQGLLDAAGELHRQGVMRLATARDELLVQKDYRVQENEAYGTLVMLSQVITRLGHLPAITPDVLEQLFAPDLAYLRELYNRLNQQGNALIATQCPRCNHAFKTELALSGESIATP